MTDSQNAQAAREQRERLGAAVRAMIDAGPNGDGTGFEPLALEIFAYQYANNSLFREFADAKNATPDTVSKWTDIPAFPTDAFKGNLVASFPFEEAVMGQITSGSTAEVRGKIFRDELGRSLVLNANRSMTGHWLFPDFEAGQRCRLLLLTPSPQMAPGMGMAIGMEETRNLFGTQDSAFLLGLSGIDVAGLIAALEQAESTGVPVALIGSTSAFVYFFNAARKRGLSYRLPAGSRVCDGGGYRGKFGKMTREDYYGLAESVLGVAPHYCVNTLGMAESATNYFDNSLRAGVTGDTGASRRKVPAPWTRVDTVSTDTLETLPPGEIGLLRHFDVANLPTVLGLQTDNLGVVFEDGSFEIVGRATVMDGKVVPLPSERTVGTMGDSSMMRMVEKYVNFTIDFKMSTTAARKAKPPVEPVEPPEPPEPLSPSCACQELQEELVARTPENE